jgi:hypothetical protein
MSVVLGVVGLSTAGVSSSGFLFLLLETFTLLMFLRKIPMLVVAAAAAAAVVVRGNGKGGMYKRFKGKLCGIHTVNGEAHTHREKIVDIQFWQFAAVPRERLWLVLGIIMVPGPQHIYMMNSTYATKESRMSSTTPVPESPTCRLGPHPKFQRNRNSSLETNVLRGNR